MCLRIIKKKRNMSSEQRPVDYGNKLTKCVLADESEQLVTLGDLELRWDVHVCYGNNSAVRRVIVNHEGTKIGHPRPTVALAAFTHDWIAHQQTIYGRYPAALQIIQRVGRTRRQL